MRALPRQMNHSRGQFSGASGSSTENLSFLALSCSTTQALTSASDFAPAAFASFTTATGVRSNWGKKGSQPSRTARAWWSMV